MKIRDKILYSAESIVEHPFIGQKEIYLDHLGLNPSVAGW